MDILVNSGESIALYVYTSGGATPDETFPFLYAYLVGYFVDATP